ncbi:hypothetical protein ACFL59_02465, partial [Planctomycetota bacterium]
MCAPSRGDRADRKPRKPKKGTGTTPREDEPAKESGTLVRVKGGGEFVSALRLRRGEKLDRLPRTVAELETDWIRWVESNYPGHDPGLPPFPQ